MSDRARATTLVALPDGRRLALDDVGDRAGRPIVFLHGTPSSRLGRPPLDEQIAALGIRLLAVDRPGIGASDPDPKTTAGSFADDLTSALDQLAIDRFDVLAWSAGAIWALAAAARQHLGARIGRLTIAAGLVPAEAFADPAVRRASHAGRRGLLDTVDDLGPEETAELVAPMLVPYPCTPALARDHLASVHEPDEAAELASVPGGIDRSVANLLATVGQGLDGLTRELAVQTAPLGVDLAAVSVPVRLVYGANDVTCPPPFGEWLAARLPAATLEVLPGAAHGFPYPRWLDLLTP
jgi:pimeloyl-ACP methyl ester carboxylesterase